MADVSGLYEWSDTSGFPFTKEALRFDVDGHFPQMVASGTGTAGLQFHTHWVASPLTATETPTGTEWRGPMLRKFGDTQLVPHEEVRFQFVEGKLRATFSGVGQLPRIRDYTFQSSSFREVALEYDAEESVDLILDYETHSHADRPASLPSETLTIDTVFERAGFRVTRTAGDGVIPSDGSGTNAAWSNAELHDAMQFHFSRIASLTDPVLVNRARWALWTFFGKIHERGNGLGGVMFDRIGTAERQGTALFLDSFIANAPLEDLTPDAWRRRMAFWTAVHEMGHAFNLLHAWQKELGVPWVPQVNSFDHLTFMNYPFFYQTGRLGNQEANVINFFRDFEFRFTDDELLFLRHAPERFVIMGGDRFGINHALEQANLSPAPDVQLEVRVNREKAEFEFLEPVVVELKLTNISSRPKLVDDEMLGRMEEMTILVQRRGGAQKAFHPYAHYCSQPSPTVLEPNDSIYESVFISVDGHEWLIDAPGYYRIQVCMHTQDGDIVSNPLSVRVSPPRNWDEEHLAQDDFSDEVGRVLTFDGSHALDAANHTLHEVTERLPDGKAAIHARVALASPRMRPFKKIEASDSANAASRYRIQEIAPDQKVAVEAAKNLGQTNQRADVAAGALGHIDYRHYTEQCAAALDFLGEAEQAAQLRRRMYDTFEKRRVLKRVLDEIGSTLESDKEKTRSRRRKKKG